MYVCFSTKCQPSCFSYAFLHACASNLESIWSFPATRTVIKMFDNRPTFTCTVVHFHVSLQSNLSVELLLAPIKLTPKGTFTITLMYLTMMCLHSTPLFERHITRLCIGEFGLQNVSPRVYRVPVDWGSVFCKFYILCQLFHA